MTTSTIPTTLNELLRHRASTIEDRTAYVFLAAHLDREQEDAMTLGSQRTRLPSCRAAETACSRYRRSGLAYVPPGT